MGRLRIDLDYNVKRLEIATKELVTSRFLGNYKSAFKGQGFEFEDYRDYTSTDDASRIDWKASKKSRKLLIKEFVEERSLAIFFLIDASATMQFGSTQKLKSEYAAELISSIAFTTLNAGDHVGFVLFNENPVKYLPIAGGKQQFYFLLNSLADPRNYSGVFNFSKAIKFLSAHIKEKALVLVVSDFIMPENNWESDFKTIAKKYDIIGFMVRDPRDMALPKENIQVLVSDYNSRDQLFLNVKGIREEYEHETKKEVNKFENSFVDNGADFLQLITNEPFLRPLISLFNQRRRKWGVG